MSEPRAVEEFKLYHYNPSKAAAIVMIVAFAISTLFHTYQLFRKRTWYFIPFVIGGTCMYPLPPDGASLPNSSPFITYP
jgi:hypothetical protein